MLWFFLIASLMVICAIAILVLPMLRSRADSEDGRDRQNIAIAREKLAQLQDQIDNGVLDTAQADEQRKEIELGLLDDIESDDASRSADASKGSWAGIVVAVALPFLAGVIYLVLGQPGSFLQGTGPFTADVALPEGHEDIDINEVVSRLESELKQTPDNPEGWYLLGSTYMTMKRFGDAAGAFGKLRQLVGDDPDLLVREADALAMASQGVLSGKPEDLLRTALELNPDHPVALWLSGIAAERRGDVEMALRHWQRAEPLFADNPESQAEIRAQISRARTRLEDDGEAQVAVQNPPATEQETTASGGAIRVHISLDSALQGEVDGGETLFILARALSGPPMPLAVVRKRAGELPLDVTLDDGMAMMPNLKLSGHEQVTVVAKLSRSGNAITQSGDLVGEASPVTPGSPDRVNVVISKRAP